MTITLRPVRPTALLDISKGLRRQKKSVKPSVAADAVKRAACFFALLLAGEASGFLKGFRL